MNKNHQIYLEAFCSQDAETANRLAVTVFLYSNGITRVKNSVIKTFLIERDHAEYKQVIALANLAPVKDIEDLIEIFEFVVSPADKVVTGAVYTPKFIREYIVPECLSSVSNLDTVTICDPACGCGGFLISAANYIQGKGKKSIKKIIEQNLFGLDIAGYSIERTKIVLCLLALLKGEDVEINFKNFFVGNALSFKWRQACESFLTNGGFDVVIGNPPYVCSRNIDSETKKLLIHWDVTNSGHPDLYIPFFQIGLELLKQKSVLGFITVNTFFKSVNGRSLREYLGSKKYVFKIIDFKDKQVFKKRCTYTCICIITKAQSNSIEYTSVDKLDNLKALQYYKNLYSSLDHFHGWNLVTRSSLREIILKIERFENKIFSKFSFSTGIATLKNDVYVFNPIETDQEFYWLKDKDGYTYAIEKKVCREVVNPNRLKKYEDIKAKKKKIIFPYQWSNIESKYKSMPEDYLRSKYPMAYQYLKSKRAVLSNRDKGTQGYETWFAYGRNQGLNVKGFKLFVPHISKMPHCVLSEDETLLFCNGEAIISESENELKVLAKILESEIFWFYIKNTSKPYSSGYVSFGKNYIKQFSLPPLTQIEKEFLIRASNKNEVNEMLLRKYDLSQSELS